MLAGTQIVINLLPHAAEMTDPRSATQVAASNLRALRDGDTLVHMVDQQRGH